MSGFIAAVNTSNTAIAHDLLETLTKSLHIRGPDQQNLWLKDTVGLGHSLFRTTNEAQYENQPASLDARVWITGCIRIDARKELLAKLKLTKTTILSKTPDSELVLHAYHKWGTGCLDHLLGDFAFAIWDDRQQTLFCARDRFGMRQLCYSHIGDLILVSNSINCLLQHPKITRTLDDTAMGDFLLFGDHSWLDKTITAFSDISALPAAHQLVYKKGKVFIKRYWEPPADLPLIHYRHHNEYLEHFLDVFNSAVADRTRLPNIVVSMSGGMDSSAIAATLCDLQRRSLIPPIEVKTITAVYDHAHPDEERYYTNIVASHLDLPTCFIPGDNYPMLRGGMTTTRPVQFETPEYWRVLKLQIAEFGRVVLTGASGDNLLECSSARTALREVNPIRLFSDILRLRMRYGKFPPMGTGLLAILKGSRQSRKNILTSAASYPDFFDPEFEKSYGLKERWFAWQDWHAENLNTRHPNAHSSLIGPDWNADDLFMAPDFTLALERDPFLDLRLVEFIFAIPTLPWLFQKDILRRSMAPLLPHKIIKRPKTPLGDLGHSLSAKLENSWINDWTPSNNLFQYVKSVPFLKADACVENSEAEFLKRRLIVLDNWVDRIKS